MFIVHNTRMQIVDRKGGKSLEKDNVYGFVVSVYCREILGLCSVLLYLLLCLDPTAVLFSWVFTFLYSVYLV